MKATAHFDAMQKRILGPTLLLLVLFFIPGAGAQSTRSEPGKPVEVQMRNVLYHFTDQISVHIRDLRGQLMPEKGDLPVFDDKTSFTIRIAWAEIAIAPESLARVLNSYVLAKPDAPLKDVAIEIEGDRLKIKGKLHSKGDIPFETVGKLSASDNGEIRLHTDKIKALHVPVKGFMELVGLRVADLIKTGKVRGVRADKDDLLFDPATLLPPPHIKGQVTAVKLEKDAIVQVFGNPSAAAAMRVPYTNYMAYRGNQLRFGKLTMNDTDLLLIDLNADDPFDFYLDHYIDQLVAGYTKETASFGLRVFMRDYDKLARGKAERTTAKTRR